MGITGDYDTALSVSQGLGTTKFTNLIGGNQYWKWCRFSSCIFLSTIKTNSKFNVWKLCLTKEHFPCYYMHFSSCKYNLKKISDCIITCLKSCVFLRTHLRFLGIWNCTLKLLINYFMLPTVTLPIILIKIIDCDYCYCLPTVK